MGDSVDKVLVISRGIIHPTIFSRIVLRKIFSGIDSIEFNFVSRLKLIDGIDINKYQSVVLFFHEKIITESHIKSLVSYVKSGGGLFCIHGALASFKSNTDYTSLLGAKFAGHDDIQEINISGKTNFNIKDELYKFKISDDCKVVLKSENEPVLWNRVEGKGKVVCLSLGHRTATFKNQKFKNLLIENIESLINREKKHEEN